jgi:ketopantoate hydroxymethyltransferase
MALVFKGELLEFLNSLMSDVITTSPGFTPSFISTKSKLVRPMCTAAALGFAAVQSQKYPGRQHL